MLVDVTAPEAKDVSLFVEGPTPDWALPMPKLVERGPPGVKRFAFELDGLPPGAKPEGAALKFTLVSGERAYEFNVNLNCPLRRSAKAGTHTQRRSMRRRRRHLGNDLCGYGSPRSPGRPRWVATQPILNESLIDRMHRRRLAAV